MKILSNVVLIEISKWKTKCCNLHRGTISHLVSGSMLRRHSGNSSRGAWKTNQLLATHVFAIIVTVLTELHMLKVLEIFCTFWWALLKFVGYKLSVNITVDNFIAFLDKHAVVSSLFLSFQSCIAERFTASSYIPLRTCVEVLEKSRKPRAAWSFHWVTVAVLLTFKITCRN